MFSTMTKVFVIFYIHNGGMGNNSNYMLNLFWKNICQLVRWKRQKENTSKNLESCQNMIMTGIIRLTKTSRGRVLKDISSKLNGSRDANNSFFAWSTCCLAVSEINRKRRVACLEKRKLQWIIIATLCHILWWKLGTGSFRKES